MRNAISGPCRDAVEIIDDRMPFTTVGSNHLLLGDITLRLEGVLTLKRCDCSWLFTGTLKSFDDFFDFNRANRGLLGEMLTMFGRHTSGVPFWIEIRGAKSLFESGTMGGG